MLFFRVTHDRFSERGTIRDLITGLTMGENLTSAVAKLKDLLTTIMSDSFVIVCVFSLRFMFVMNVLQPKFSVNTRTWDVKKWYELVYIFKKTFQV